MKVQGFPPSGVVHVILDLVYGDRLIAQVAPDLLPVPCIDGVGERDR
jgi:hypothetical protein